VIHEAGGEIDFADLEIFAVDEFFEMIADEVFHFGVGHGGFWIFDFRLLRRSAHRGLLDSQVVARLKKQFLGD
jgi:hypothetical protein